MKFALALVLTIASFAITTPTYDPRPRLPESGERIPGVRELIVRAAEGAGISPTTALSIAQCESGFDPAAQNPVSSAGGLYQFTIPTWEYIGSPGDRFDAVDSINAFVTHYPTHPWWWECK